MTFFNLKFVNMNILFFPNSLKSLLWLFIYFGFFPSFFVYFLNKFCQKIFDSILFCLICLMWFRFVSFRFVSGCCHLLLLWFCDGVVYLLSFLCDCFPISLSSLHFTYSFSSMYVCVCVLCWMLCVCLICWFCVCVCMYVCMYVWCDCHHFISSVQRDTLGARHTLVQWG